MSTATDARGSQSRGRLFRSMQAQGDVPAVGSSARTLGARFDDIEVDDDGLVRPGTGGISVAPDEATNLPAHRLLPEYGGTGKDPVWWIGEDDLGDRLSYRPDPDPDTPNHGFIEPAHTMTFEEYQQALQSTQARWRRL